jgi:hypothetical protein
MRLVWRAVAVVLVFMSVALSVSAIPICQPAMPSIGPVLRILVPDTASDRWYLCRSVAEEDVGVTIALNVMPTVQEGVTPPHYPIDVMREVIYEMIANEDLPDMAMIPLDLAREISDRCYIYDLDAYSCWVQRPFRYDGAIDGVILPWASDLVLVFFEPGDQVILGLALLSHPVLASMRPPAGCCGWPRPEPEPEPFCCP